MPSLNIYTIYMIAIAVLLCVIEFVLVRMEKNDLAIGLPILVLTESFVSGLNLALLSLILFLIMVVTKRVQTRPCFKNCRVLHHFNKMAIAPM